MWNTARATRNHSRSTPGVVYRPPDQSSFLFGMRGVGKSTSAQQVLPAAPRFELLDEGLYQSYLRDARLFGREVAALPPGSWIIVDEIQRLPALLNEVHRFIEERRRRFVLVGSSARKLKQAGTNLLAGRAVRRVIMPLLLHLVGPNAILVVFRPCHSCSPAVFLLPPSPG